MAGAAFVVCEVDVMGNGERRSRFRRVAGLVAGVGVLGLLLGGVATATIPSSTTGQVAACYRVSGGALRVIDVQKKQRCVAGERLLAWGPSYIWRGAYNPKAAYAPGSVVVVNGSSYVARMVVPKGRAPGTRTGASYWGLLAASGIAGQPGPSGPPGPKGDTGATGPAGLSYISSLGSSVSTPVGTDMTVAPPAGYTLSVVLTSGKRYLVTGDVTFWNAYATAGIVVCYVYDNGSERGMPRIQDIPLGSHSTVPFSITFTATSTGTHLVYLGCYRGSTIVDYMYGNLTVFQVASPELVWTPS